MTRPTCDVVRRGGDGPEQPVWADVRTYSPNLRSKKKLAMPRLMERSVAGWPVEVRKRGLWHRFLIWCSHG